MENMEEVLMELNQFGNSKSVPDSLPPVLEDYLAYVAKTGTTVFPWNKIKPLFRAKLERVMTEFCPNPETEEFPPVPNVDHFSFGACKDKVFQQLDCFNGIPFTVQRLCELLIAPRKHYKRTDKFMRALEKNMLVVSTVDPQLLRKGEADENKEKKPLKSQTAVNGESDHQVKTPSPVLENKEEIVANGDHSEGPCDSGRQEDNSDATPVVKAQEEETKEEEKPDSAEKEEASGPCDSAEDADAKSEQLELPSSSASASTSTSTTTSTATSVSDSQGDPKESAAEEPVESSEKDPCDSEEAEMPEATPSSCEATEATSEVTESATSEGSEMPMEQS